MPVFGTDGIRGRYGSPALNRAIVQQVAHAVGSYVAAGNNRRVIIAGDTRFSTQEVIDTIKTCLRQWGITVAYLGIVPTPVLAYMTAADGYALGIMVTASHNPWQDNGIKFFNHKGRKLSAQQRTHFESLMQQEHLPEGSGKGQFFSTNADAYWDMLQARLPADFNHGRIVVDAANGAASAWIAPLFSALPSQLIEVASHPNGENINVCSGVTNPQNAIETVRKTNAQVGIILDGDGDRVHLVDEQGTLVDGDAILYILARFLAHQGSGVVGTQMSNLGLEQALNGLQVGFTRTAVGDQYVLEALLEKGWQYGAEPSGHVICMQENPTGDGLLAAITVLNLMAQHQCRLSDLLSDYQPHPLVLINERVQNAKQLLEQAEIAHYLSKQQAVIERIGGRVLIRASGTEPLVRIMVEMPNVAQAEQQAEQIREYIRTQHNQYEAAIEV